MRLRRKGGVGHVQDTDMELPLRVPQYRTPAPCTTGGPTQAQRSAIRAVASMCPCGGVPCIPSGALPVPPWYRAFNGPVLQTVIASIELNRSALQCGCPRASDGGTRKYCDSPGPQ